MTATGRNACVIFPREKRCLASQRASRDRGHRRAGNRNLWLKVSPFAGKAHFMVTLASPITARVLNSALAQKIMSATEAAALIRSGDQIGMSGFTGSGYPKAVPIELARRIAEAHIPRAEVSGQRVHGRLHRPRTRRRARHGGRHSSAASLPVRSRDAQAHQRRRNGLHGHPSEPRRSVRGVRLPRQDGCRAHRSRCGARRRPTAPQFVDRQQQDVDRPGGARDSRSQFLAARRARRHARHLLRPAAASQSRADSAGQTGPANRHPVSQRSRRESRRHRADRLSRPQQRLQGAG